MIIKQILNVVETALQEIPELKYIAEDWGQLDCEQPPIKFPCALIEIDGFSFSQLGGLAQYGEGTINVIIADMKSQHVSANAPDVLKEASNAYFQLLEIIHKKLHGLDIINCAPLMQIGLKRNKRDVAIREYTFTFSTAYREEPLNRYQTFQIENPQVGISPAGEGV